MLVFFFLVLDGRVREGGRTDGERRTRTGVDGWSCNSSCSSFFKKSLHFLSMKRFFLNPPDATRQSNQFPSCPPSVNIYSRAQPKKKTKKPQRTKKACGRSWTKPNLYPSTQKTNPKWLTLTKNTRTWQDNSVQYARPY